MTYKDTLTGRGPDDFCLLHGYDHMRSRMGDPIPYCEACEKDQCSFTPDCKCELCQKVAAEMRARGQDLLA